MKVDTICKSKISAATLLTEGVHVHQGGRGLSAGASGSGWMLLILFLKDPFILYILDELEKHSWHFQRTSVQPE